MTEFDVDEYAKRIRILLSKLVEIEKSDYKDDGRIAPEQMVNAFKTRYPAAFLVMTAMWLEDYRSGNVVVDWISIDRVVAGAMYSCPRAILRALDMYAATVTALDKSVKQFMNDIENGE